jgi:hypothetical protein
MSIFLLTVPRLAVLLEERKRLAVVVKVVVIAGSNTVDVVHVPSIIQALFPWHKASTLDNLLYVFDNSAVSNKLYTCEEYDKCNVDHLESWKLITSSGRPQ